MENGGNAKVNAIFEARLTNPSAKPGQHADGPTRERFIRDKYERRKFFDPQGFAEYAAHVDMHPGAPDTSRPSSAPPASRGPPSDAAKQRLEERRIRISKASSSVEDDSRNNIKKSTARQKMQIAQAPVSAPLAANVDLLDLMDTPQKTSEQQQPSKTPETNAAMDLFGDFVTAGNATDKPSETASNKPQTNFGADILSLYGNNNINHQLRQQTSNGYANDMIYQNNGMNNNNHNNKSNMMMMNANNNNNNNNMMQMQNMMQNMAFQQQAMLSPQQQQQQQQGMMMMMMTQQHQQQQQFGTNNAMMMNYNNNNSFYPNNMMPGVGVPGYNPNNINMMMMNPVAGGVGMNHVSGNTNQQQQPPIRQIQFTKSTASAAVTKQKPAEKDDPFAQFGMNVFRS